MLTFSGAGLIVKMALMACSAAQNQAFVSSSVSSHQSPRATATRRSLIRSKIMYFADEGSTLALATRCRAHEADRAVCLLRFEQASVSVYKKVGAPSIQSLLPVSVLFGVIPEPGIEEILKSIRAVDDFGVCAGCHRQDQHGRSPQLTLGLRRHCPQN